MWEAKVVTSLILVIILPIIALPLIGMALQCEEHEVVELFSFQSYNSTALSDVKSFCKKCDESLGVTLFRESPEDVSYLNVVKEHSDGSELIGGEYYTMTAIVTLIDYDPSKTKLRCKVESENIIVGFSVDFREEFEEQVALIEKDDEIVFRGRFYDKGCGFTDCELITD